MSRSGYSDDIDQWQLIRWRGAVASAMKGQRGQQFLRELIASLDAMPEKSLIARELEQGSKVCALGCVGKVRGLDMSTIDPEDHEAVAEAFGIAHAMTCEIMYENDDEYRNEKPEERWTRMRRWAEKQLANVPQ